ncbi:hypothetical protein CROQUDRAFT_88920 [Cronartium quercuum f. sp. fusiforme G11]|uniref:chitin deacetylase n=1 Tax=Cronartium quercuum f. sp. fusiforme G11 TaxID=708437 RepID=A0A9P6NSL1_9BASI|nr:hypothetical protein CROQUDRAFT_88920 [Cronartium quercuum f. sp. fusiforme G11]
MVFSLASVLVVLSLLIHYTSCERSGQHRTRLFQRQISPINLYPPLDISGPTPKPEWVDAYNQERQSGRIPSFAPSVKLPSGGISYDSSLDPLSSEVCSWTEGCRSPSDISDAPDGMMGISFDDGPQAGTPPLLNFLKTVNQTVTHFMIGSRILENTQGLMAALQQGDHIAVHTWSHPMMSTQSDQAILGELGWTLQIIYDLTGRLPAYWRPPYGDVDNRVRAIAENVFGMQTVIWNHDTFDWCLSPQDTNTCIGEGPVNEADLLEDLKDFSKLPKSPGLIILEHEITTHSTLAFVNSWKSFKAAGWDLRDIPSLFGHPWYQNAVGAFDKPTHLTSILDATPVVGPTSTLIQSSASTQNNTENITQNTTENITQNTTQPTSQSITDPSTHQKGKNSASSRANLSAFTWWTFGLILSVVNVF